MHLHLGRTPTEQVYEVDIVLEKVSSLLYLYWSHKQNVDGYGLISALIDTIDLK